MEDAVPTLPLAPSPALFAAAVAFTRRRSHLDSASYRALSRLFSHCLHLHPSRREGPAPPDAEPAAANPTVVESGDPPQAPKDADFDRRKNVGKEAAAAGGPSRHETVSPARDQPAAANPTVCPGEAEAPQGSLEDVDEVVVVESTSGKTGTRGEESGAGAGLVVEEEALKSVKACLEGEVDESVEGAVVNDDGQLLLDAIMTNFTELIDDVGAGAMPAQSSAVSGGELQSNRASEELKQSGDGIEDTRPVSNSDSRQIDGGGFEEGEIEGELQDLDSEEFGDSELGDKDEKLEGDSVSRGSGANESCDHDTRCGNLHLTSEIKRNGYPTLNKDASVRDDAQMCVTRAQAVSYDEVVDWNETPLPNNEAPNPGKKRKHHLTEARKAQKTKRKRINRAQQQITEGVNKLILKPVIKPKPVKKCHFYDHGKCQQGNSCKFSHDFTPLTKSKACSHFARGSCLKGDDCPYDHELSKHCCHNFKNGMCFRGDKCKFSHVMPTTEGTSPPDAKKSDASLAFEKTNLRDHTSSQKTSTVHNGEPVISAPTKQQYSTHKYLAGISFNSQKVSTRIPKGVQFLPFSKGGSNSSSLHQDALSIEMHRNANGSQHQYLGGQQTEEQKNVKQNGQKPVPLLDENNSSKQATMHPCSDPKKASLPNSTATPGSIHTQHEVSEASRILQEFLFGAGS
ncbi:zinc finger CCCH domain-containing protein 7-like [Phragmites australis]|uniref:zinc finger CCCH domain-containing protein 7-like n=1 Tax=Phragmites australis TaxID=29695 RepID=UPI002D79D159|nr:zinc finger CCCH domain-containing protein 7-like [Phragmites australis]XP_062213630.1 zinc finger CCCH domain-containing protein 7-like [Phragmites australis]XP_062213633.1 zinc finger CCCH domain-containing protein 7-like [Phragmites australis]